jgi:hypothetical protein
MGGSLSPEYPAFADKNDKASKWAAISWKNKTRYQSGF